MPQVKPLVVLSLLMGLGSIPCSLTSLISPTWIDYGLDAEGIKFGLFRTCVLQYGKHECASTIQAEKYTSLGVSKTIDAVRSAAIIGLIVAFVGEIFIVRVLFSEHRKSCRIGGATLLAGGIITAVGAFIFAVSTDFVFVAYGAAFIFACIGAGLAVASGIVAIVASGYIPPTTQPFFPMRTIQQDTVILVS